MQRTWQQVENNPKQYASRGGGFLRTTPHYVGNVTNETYSSDWVLMRFYDNPSYLSSPNDTTGGAGLPPNHNAYPAPYLGEVSSDRILLAETYPTPFKTNWITPDHYAWWFGWKMRHVGRSGLPPGGNVLRVGGSAGWVTIADPDAPYTVPYPNRPHWLRAWHESNKGVYSIAEGR